LIIDFLLGDVCLMVGPTLSAEIDRLRDSEGSGGDGTFLEKHAKVRETHHAVSHHHSRAHIKAKIVVVDDILLVLGVVGKGISLFKDIRDFSIIVYEIFFLNLLLLLFP